MAPVGVDQEQEHGEQPAYGEDMPGHAGEGTTSSMATATAHADAIYCGPVCRTAAYRARRRAVSRITTQIGVSVTWEGRG
ncbi:MAG: hypothetical protein ACRDZO_13845 [Egibacteraceae bacterium]